MGVLLIECQSQTGTRIIIRMGVLKAIRFKVYPRPVLIKPTLIKSLNICQPESEKEGHF
jgi:hypothetical protein